LHGTERTALTRRRLAEEEEAVVVVVVVHGEGFLKAEGVHSSTEGQESIE